MCPGDNTKVLHFRGALAAFGRLSKKNFCVSLQFGRQVDAVVLADEADGLWGQLLSLGRDAHGIEDGTTRGEVATEGAGRDAGQTDQRALADEAVFVVVVNHIICHTDCTDNTDIYSN